MAISVAMGSPIRLTSPPPASGLPHGGAPVSDLFPGAREVPHLAAGLIGQFGESAFIGTDRVSIRQQR
jgi:hypothetical protein